VKVTNSETLIGWAGKKREFHEVFHQKLSFEWSPCSYTIGPAPGSSLAFEHAQSNGSSWAGRGELYENKPTAPNGLTLIPGSPGALEPHLDWVKAYESLLDDAHGLLPAQKSLAVNVAEFTQVKRLVPSLAKSIRGILRWAKGGANGRMKIRSYRTRKGYLTSRYRTVELRSLQWCLRDLAQAHLAYSFGVRPLAEDLGEFAGKLWEVKMHQNWWKTISDGRAHAVHASVTASLSNDTRVADNTYYTVTDYFQQKSVGVLGAYVTVKPVTEETAQKRLFQQIIGWNVPGSILWELVPFSFVVDWFLPVGEIINRFEPKRFLGSLAAQVTIGTRWSSVKHQVTVSRRLESTGASYAGPFGRKDKVRITDAGGGVARLHSYSRNPHWPDFSLIPPRGVFGLRQAGLSLSLVVAKLFK
jgi:hypothetical protein